MVTFRGDLTDPPKVSTSDPSGTVKAWAGYAVVAAMAAVVLGFAFNSLAPMLGNLLSIIPGFSSPQTGIPVRRVS